MEHWPQTLDLLRRLYSTAEPVESHAWDLPSFLASYTLHDSGFVEARLDPDDGLLLLIAWDMVWNRRVPAPYHNLVIGVRTVYSVSWSQGSWSDTILSDAASQRLTEAERARMLDDGTVELRAYQHGRDQIPPPFDDDTLTRTTIQWNNWARLTILHGGDVRFLCLDDGGAAGPLPKVGG